MLLSPCHSVPDQSARETKASTFVLHLFFVFFRDSVQRPRTLMMLSKCSLCPPAKWESQRGWARVRDAQLPALGRGGGKALFIQHEQHVFYQCNSLLWLVHRGTMNGLGQSLLPSLLNHV